jgi:NADPH2:quinone reductase
MKAWRVHGFGPPEETFVLEDVPPPSKDMLAGLVMNLAGWADPAAGDAELAGPAHADPEWVLMQMSVAALALPDVTMCRGTYPVPVPRPYTSGQEGVGVVIDASAGRASLIGRRVTACTIQPFGSLAPVAVGVGLVFEVPDGLDDEAAAGFIIPAHTAYHAAIRRGQVREGETVAVLGAAGGLGAAIIQLVKARGAQVVAIVGGADKIAFCRDLGADIAVDHRAGDFVGAVRAATGGRGVDVVIDPVQGEMGAAARDLLVPDGRHVLCGHAGGLQPIDPHFYLRNQTLVGVTLGGYPGEQMAAMEAETQAAVVDLLERGAFRPATTRVVDFDEVPAAVGDLDARRTMGRVAVRI